MQLVNYWLVAKAFAPYKGCSVYRTALIDDCRITTPDYLTIINNKSLTR